MEHRLPPRGPALIDQAMILSFDVDCGELIPGHRFIARGLAGPMMLPIPDDWDGDESEYKQMLEFLEGAGYPGFSLEYEIVPGVPVLPDDRNFFHYLVGVSYAADVELPWEPHDGGAIAPFQGGGSTHGSRGDWPLPPSVTTLRFALYAVGPTGFKAEEPAGELVVELSRGHAEWQAV